MPQLRRIESPAYHPTEEGGTGSEADEERDDDRQGFHWSLPSGYIGYLGPEVIALHHSAMPTTYNGSILDQYAEDLYQQANSIVWMTALKYGLVSCVGSIALCFMQQAARPGAMSDGVMIMVVLVATLIGGVAGKAAGERLAFELRLKAQQVLCQRQIELNTLRTAPVSQPAAARPLAL